MRFSTLIASLTAGASVTVAAGNANSQRIIADLNSAAEASMLELQSQACDLSGKYYGSASVTQYGRQTDKTPSLYRCLRSHAGGVCRRYR